MKRSTTMWVALAAAVSTASMTSDNDRALLNAEDYRLEQESALSPSVVAPDSNEVAYWESFNRWVCFSAQDAKIECEPGDGQATTCYPRLIVQTDSERMSFELLMGDNSLNSGAILDRWNFLLSNTDSICALSALLPDVPSPQDSVFSLQRLKTARGYWDYDWEDNWREADETGDD